MFRLRVPRRLVALVLLLSVHGLLLSALGLLLIAIASANHPVFS